MLITEITAAQFNTLTLQMQSNQPVYDADDLLTVATHTLDTMTIAQCVISDSYWMIVTNHISDVETIRSIVDFQQSISTLAM